MLETIGVCLIYDNLKITCTSDEDLQEGPMCGKDSFVFGGTEELLNWSLRYWVRINTIYI